MDEMPVSTRKSIPAWYQIGIYTDTTLVIKIHPKAKSLLDKLKGEAPIISAYKQKFNLTEFIPPSEKRWGFGQMIETRPDQKGWAVYHCPLPIVKRRSDEQALNRSAEATVRSSLSLFFLALQGQPKESTEHDVPQLIIIDYLSVEQGMSGGAISATLSSGMFPYLANPSTRSLKSIEAAMKTAYEYVWQDEASRKHLAGEFKVRHEEPAKIHLSVPSHGSGLIADSNSAIYKGPDRGYRLVPHSLDSGPQQMAILMGLARLHELALKMYLL